VLTPAIAGHVQPPCCEVTCQAARAVTIEDIGPLIIDSHSHRLVVFCSHMPASAADFIAIGLLVAGVSLGWSTIR
jgi:hypothetical protein